MVSSTASKLVAGLRAAAADDPIFAAPDARPNEEERDLSRFTSVMEQQQQQQPQQKQQQQQQKQQQRGCEGDRRSRRWSEEKAPLLSRKNRSATEIDKEEREKHDSAADAVTTSNGPKSTRSQSVNESDMTKGEVLSSCWVDVCIVHYQNDSKRWS